MKELKSDILAGFSDVEHGFIYDVSGKPEVSSGKLSGYSAVKTLNQVHSDIIVHLDDSNLHVREYTGDALFTFVRGICIGVYTADCVPVLLFDHVHKTVAAIHAGWRGTLAAITSKTVNAIVEKSSTAPDNLVAIIGPCIGGCCYEVDNDVASAFIRSFDDHREYVSLTGKGKYIVDLEEANILQLKKSGIKEIEGIGMCTKCNVVLPSYRRDGSGTGRIFSYIAAV